MIKIKSILISAVSAVMLFGVCAATAGCSGNGKVDNLQQQIAELESKLGEQNDKISDMQEEIDNQNDRIEDLEQKNTNLSNRLQELERQVELEMLKGNLCSLDKASKLGLLTQNDLLNISYYCMGERHIQTQICEDFTPAPKNPEVLSEETEYAIRQAYLIYDKHDPYYPYISQDNSDKTIEDVRYEYLGTYNNCVAIRVWWFNENSDGGFPAISTSRYVDGVSFNYTNYYENLIWVNN